MRGKTIMGLFSNNEKAQLAGRHIHDQAGAIAPQALRAGTRRQRPKPR